MTKYILVLQIGTYCDHYLMNYLVSSFRNKYTLVFISNKRLFINSHDINIYHDLPIEILNYGSEIVTGFSTSQNLIFHLFCI